MLNITETTFFGHRAIQINTTTLKLIITTDCGPRIAFFGKNEKENLLFWDSENRGRDDWKLRGGHRVWVARPNADEAEETYFADNNPCAVTKSNDSITILGAVDPIIKTQRGIKITVLSHNKLAVDNILINKSNMLYSGSIWALTCTNPNPKHQYGIPLGDNNSWDCFRVVYFRRWGGGSTSQVNDPQISLTQDLMLINPKGIETKRMIEAPQGIIAMDIPEQDTMFIKQVGYEPAGNHPLGCNLAFYIGKDNFMVEMETMGPEAIIKPNQEAVWREIWVLTDKSYGFNDIKKLTEQVYA
jgi:hypothetical protein